MPLSIAVTRRGEGPAILLIHGIPGAGAIWTEVAEELSSEHTVLVPDLLGFGASPRPPSLDHLWADFQAERLMESLGEFGFDRLAVVGHDFGGPVAVHLYRRRPHLVSHLVLASTNTFPDTPIPFPLSLLTVPGAAAAFTPILFSRFSLRMMLRTGVGTPRVPLDPAVYLGDAEQRRAIATIFSGALRELQSRYAPVAAALSGIDVPTLIVWGDRDPFFPLEQGRRTSDAIQGARLKVFQDAGHFLPEERPRALATAIVEHVAGTLGS